MTVTRLPTKDLQLAAREVQSEGSKLNAADLDVIARGVEALMRGTVRRVQELSARVAVLEADKARLAAAIERAEEQKYIGTWCETEHYKCGNSITHDGSCWIAMEPSINVRPGSSPSWRLATKRGKNGRDLR